MGVAYHGTKYDPVVPSQATNQPAGVKPRAYKDERYDELYPIDGQEFRPFICRFGNLKRGVV